MNAALKILYRSPGWEVKNFVCKCTDCTLSGVEYQDKFSICFIRKGNFLFKVFKSDLDAHTGYCLLNKPGFEHRVGHTHTIPDQCTIISFSQSFYEEIKETYGRNLNGFLLNPDCASLLVQNDIYADYLHHLLFQGLEKTFQSILETDQLVIDLLNHLFLQEEPGSKLSLSFNHKQYLSRIELAKGFIQSNFSENISLRDIATYCGMSVFHFARIFKCFTTCSPHEYLMDFRLCHAKTLLRATNLTIQDISTESGFNNPDYFSTAFKKTHFVTPLQYRHA